MAAVTASTTAEARAMWRNLGEVRSTRVTVIVRSTTNAVVGTACIGPGTGSENDVIVDTSAIAFGRAIGQFGFGPRSADAAEQF